MCIRDSYIPVPKKGNIIVVAAPQPIHWHKLHPKNTTVQDMSNRLEIDFTEIVKIARRTNMSLWQQLYQAIHAQVS